MATQRDDPRSQLRKEKERLELSVDGAPETDGPGTLRGDLTEGDSEAILDLLEALDAEHPGKSFRANGNGRETLEPKTLSNYGLRLRLATTAADGGLLEQTTETINDLMADMATGDAEIAPSDGYSKGTVGQYQSALKAFYRFHDGHDVDPEEIPVLAPENTTVDERDMFAVDEVKAMRDAVDSPRERALFELLAYTGQRIRVIQTLRIKDVDVDEGVLYINESEAGRKGASGKRPLLGAKEYVRQWLEYHPTGGAEDYLITPGATGGGTPGEQLTQDTMRYHLEKIADKADVEKDVHPHIFRHYFTTVAKRDYGMDDAYIKQLRGDAPGSNVMETTYQHLSDSDAIKHAEEKAGMRQPEPSTAHTPDACPTCGELLEEGSKACGRCGAVFTPDARATKEEMQEEAEGMVVEVESEQESRVVQAVLKDLRENPEELLSE